ncbi:MAG: hypothetical protein ACD_77C00034G0001 [uncultured bacterium]|nr:MAG: hypothetical protein ACD_77C00034G0001 [uncultured bacterium]
MQILEASDIMEQTSKQVKIERKVVIKLIDGTIIRGLVNLNSDTVPLDRISDLFIKGEKPFIVIYGSTVGGKHDQVFVVNKGLIMWASPTADEGDWQY